MPGIDGRNAGGREVSDIACDHGQTVGQGRRSNQRIPVRTPIWNMQPGATLRDGRIDDQNSTREGGQNMVVPLDAKHTALRRVSSFEQQHPSFQFQNGDG